MNKSYISPYSMYFMKKNNLYSKKNQGVEWYYFNFLKIALMCGLIKDSWILMSVSAFNML